MRLAFWEPKELTNESEQLIIGMACHQEAGFLEIKYCAGRVEGKPKAILGIEMKYGQRQDKRQDTCS